MSQTLNVLSIDFDYFQKVSRDILLNDYPAGCDLSTELSIYTWSGYYNNPKSAKELQKVEILEDELNHLKKLLLSDCLSDDADVMITNSHVFIYDLIHDCMEKNDHYKDIRCINIDLHHDFVNGSEEVDCGNWVSHLYKDYGDHFKFNWVVNPISREMFDLNEEIFDKKLLKSLADIKIKDFDVVFLCRSDNFFAPHLDPYFDEIVRLIESRFHDTRIEKSVNEVRDYRKYDSMYEKLHKSLKNS